MRPRRVVLAVLPVVLVATVAACTTSSEGTHGPDVPLTTTATTTQTVTSAAPPTGSGVPAASTSPAASSTPSATASGPGLCTPTVLTLAVGRTEGAAGTAYFPVVVTNASQQPCVTTGYPGVALLNAAGKQVLQATRDPGAPGATITLAPGEKATAVVAAESGPSGADCATYPAMLFTMPDNTDSTKLVHSQFACGVRVRAFVKGATG